MFGRIPPVKLPGPGLLFAGRFFIKNAMSLLVTSLCSFSISSWFKLEKFHISRRVPISSRFPVCCHLNICSILLWIFWCLCGILCHFSSFISYFVYLGPLFFLSLVRAYLFVSLQKLAPGFTVTQQETEPELPAGVEGPPVETRVVRGSPQGSTRRSPLV